jgi:hypothetical protein
VWPQFENGGTKSLAHRATALVAMPASKPAGSLAANARDQKGSGEKGGRGRLLAPF